MRAMILAAGRGERLRPLTDDLPKPLIPVGGKPVIEWHLERLARAGFRDVVINLCHLGDKLRLALGDGRRWRLQLHYSNEADVPDALETGGGVVRALPLLGQSPFLLINGDIWCDYPVRRLRSMHCEHAHLVLVNNPEHNDNGDFHLAGGRVQQQGSSKLTYSGIAVFHPGFFHHCKEERFSLVPLLREAMDDGRVTGEHYRGKWFDMGTPERLHLLRQTFDEPV